MNMAKKVLRAVDEYQQKHAWLAFPVAVWKKFGDDQAGNLAALIAYYAFASLFPLLLVLVTVLDIVLRSNPGLKAQVLDSAFGQFPVIGPQLKTDTHALQCFHRAAHDGEHASHLAIAALDEHDAHDGSAPPGR